MLEPEKLCLYREIALYEVGKISIESVQNAHKFAYLEKAKLFKSNHNAALESQLQSRDVIG